MFFAHLLPVVFLLKLRRRAQKLKFQCSSSEQFEQLVEYALENTEPIVKVGQFC